MSESKFWADFYAAWGKDSSRGEANKSIPVYNKDAWVYVQRRMQEYFKDQKFRDRIED